MSPVLGRNDFLLARSRIVCSRLGTGTECCAMQMRETHAVSTSLGNSLTTFRCPSVCLNFSISCCTFWVVCDFRAFSSALSEDNSSLGDREASEDSVVWESEPSVAIFFRMFSKTSDSWAFNFSSSAATRCAMCSSRDFARVEFVYWKGYGCE